MPGVRENRCSPTATRPAMAKWVTSARPVMLATRALVDRILGASCRWHNAEFAGRDWRSEHALQASCIILFVLTEWGF
jgi:hypothetical protein